jgi:hypothetical protein
VSFPPEAAHRTLGARTFIVRDADGNLLAFAGS